MKILRILLSGSILCFAAACQRLNPTSMVEVVGVYPVTAEEPCHLIELRIPGVSDVFNFGSFTQETPGQPRSHWQVPWMERILSADGTKILADDSGIKRKPDLFRGDVRCVFFFHYLDTDRPLLTPFGKVDLPQPTAKPERLSDINYEEPGS